MRRDHYLWLRPGVQVLQDNDDLILIDQEGEVVQIPDPSSLAYQLVQRLAGEEPRSTLEDNPYLALLEPLLNERKWLVTLRRPLSELLDSHLPLSREISAFAHSYPYEVDFHFTLLAKKKVLIVGTGGIGSNVAFALCANGIGALTLVDHDVIELTNLNRQFLFTASDVALHKVEVVARELSRRFTNTAIDAVAANFDDAELAARLVQDVDLIVICGESSVLHDQPHLSGKAPILLAGYRGATGIVGPLIDPAAGSACWPCVMQRYERPAMREVQSAVHARERAWNPSGFAINSMTGALCSTICVAYLSQQPSGAQWIGTQLRISSTDLEIEKISTDPPSCPHTLSSNKVSP